ncbi:alpha/beta fold hydrolase [Patescibacteria group bacterium]
MDFSIKKGFYKSKGLYLNYISFGQGKPIIFLHGGAFNALTYKTLLKLLAKNYLVIAPDLPCFGNSFVPDTPWNFADYANLLDGFINSLKLNDVVLIGHSLGGGVAWYLSLINNNITKLVLIDSSGIPLRESKIRFYFSIIKKTINEFVFYDKKIALFLIKEFFTGFIFKHLFKLSLVIKTINRLAYSSLISGTVEIPTLILWGNKDEVIPVKYSQEFKNLAPNSQLEIVEGNHDWCLFYPDIAHSKIVDFLQQEN